MILVIQRRVKKKVLKKKRKIKENITNQILKDENEKKDKTPFRR